MLRRLTYLIVGFLAAIFLFGLAAVKGVMPAAVTDALVGLLIERQPYAYERAPDQPVNVLIMGLQIGGAATNPLTDSLMVASYDPRARSLSLLGIPRDLYVEIPGYGSSRINEAFQAGGAELAMLTVQQNLGIPINYYALVSYEAFERLIDNAGGVTVDVPYDIDDPYFPAPDEINFEPFKITKGVHHLNGREALRYVRTRKTDPLGDIGRSQRQQQVLNALKEQVLKPANILKLGKIMRDVRQTVKTNFPLDQAGSLGLAVLGSPEGSVRRAVLSYENGAFYDGTTPYGAQVLMPDSEVIKEIVGEVFAPALSYFDAGAAVQVANGAGYAGAATQFSRILAGMGAETLEPTDADRTDYAEHIVRVYTRDRAKVQEARLIAGMLGARVEEGRGPSEAEILVILGRNYAPFAEFTEADWERAITP